MLEEYLMYAMPIVIFIVIFLLIIRVLVLAILFFQWIATRSNLMRVSAEITVLKRLKLRKNIA